MKESYRVGFWQDNEYEVIKSEWHMDVRDEEDQVIINESQVFKGRLSDCEAYIRLHEAGYI